MSVYLDDPELKEKIALVEGPDWMRQGNHQDVSRARMEFAHKGRASAIYGVGGWSRWIVRRDGRVVYSAEHAGHKLAEVAGLITELGFDVE